MTAAVDVAVLEPRRSLWRDPEFAKLWGAETLSQLGSQVSLLAIPLIAIGLLHASTFEVAQLSTVELLPFVLFGLPAGAWIDRRRRHPLLVVGDLARAAALASIPIAYAVAALSLLQLYIVAFVVGSFTVVFDIAYEAYLPSLIRRDQLVDGYAKLELGRSGATIAGPSIAGALIAAASAPIAVAANAVGFAASAVCIWRIRRREPGSAAAPGDAPAALWPDIREGLRYVVADAHLRAIAACTATSNLFLSMGTAVLLVYLIREIHLAPAELGVVFGLGNIGLLIGALAANRVAGRIGVGPTIVVSMALAGGAGIILPLAPPAAAAALVAISQIVSGLATTIYNVNQVSLRQAIAPPGMRGRINATMRFAVWGTIPVGSFLGGVLGARVGLLATLWIAALGGQTAVLWIVLSPVRALHRVPMTDAALTANPGRCPTQEAG